MGPVANPLDIPGMASVVPGFDPFRKPAYVEREPAVKPSVLITEDLVLQSGGVVGQPEQGV